MLVGVQHGIMLNVNSSVEYQASLNCEDNIGGGYWGTSHGELCGGRLGDMCKRTAISGNAVQCDPFAFEVHDSARGTLLPKTKRAVCLTCSTGKPSRTCGRPSRVSDHHVRATIKCGRPSRAGDHHVRATITCGRPSSEGDHHVRATITCGRPSRRKTANCSVEPYDLDHTTDNRTPNYGVCC
jgi:hypothetical protein